jgi:UDP-2,4-diacetamido-2,4,6-trideoxy-beta-L-altropyranose hydrolase
VAALIGHWSEPQWARMAQATNPRILFAPASGPGVGGGHIMRDLALARALQDRGAVCASIAAKDGRELITRFAEVEMPVFERSAALASLADAAMAFGADALVLDDYGLDADDVDPLRSQLPAVVVIDDLADRRYACDLLIDPGYGRIETDYAGRVPADCRLALGPGYALVRADVAVMARNQTRVIQTQVAGVFVSFGLSDVDGIAARAIRTLRPLAPAARFDVALSSDAPSLPALSTLARTDPGLHIHPDARDIAALMQPADIAVGAGGSSTWERCALGLPTLAAIVADNQRGVTDRLAQAGVLLAVDMAGPEFDRRLGEAFAALLEPELRTQLSGAARALCDGQGAGRAADAILSLIGDRLSLR